MKKNNLMELFFREKNQFILRHRSVIIASVYGKFIMDYNLFVYCILILNLIIIVIKSHELNIPCSINLNENYTYLGELITTEMGYEYCAFYGIPYAEAPVGELRYEV